jgi:hypothetical protein
VVVSELMAGKVVGVVGRMGSGKSYFAVRMAYRRLGRGENVCSNFTVNTERLRGRRRWWLPFTRVKTTFGTWTPFYGWEQIAELENCVVIVDEAHLYAPSSKSLQFPMVARWKLSMARKFGLDVYWISQHEDRVNRSIRDLTNLIYVCNAWFDHLAFSAKGYEPEKVRRKDQHVDRRFYFFSKYIASLYDTLEVLQVDEHLGDESIDRAHAIGNRYNDARRRRGGARDERSRAVSPVEVEAGAAHVGD